MSDILIKMVKLSPANVTCQSNADSGVVTEVAICCQPSHGTQNVESVEGQHAMEDRDS